MRWVIQCEKCERSYGMENKEVVVRQFHESIILSISAWCKFCLESSIYILEVNSIVINGKPANPFFLLYDRINLNERR